VAAVALAAAGLAGRAPRAWIALQAARYGIFRNNV
jgi:hypothetical protein